MELLERHFEIALETPDGIKKLRKLILSLAIQGKLVPQDPKDQAVSELLKEIDPEKKRSNKAGKIKRRESVQSIKLEEMLREVPKGWEWAYLPQVVTNDKYSIKRGPFGSSIKKAYFVPRGYKVYEQKNAIYDDFSLGEYYIDEAKFLELKAFEVKPNDIIISCSGTVGKVAVAPASMEPGIINQALLKISLNNNALLNVYFKVLFAAFFMNTDTLSNLKGTAQKNIVSVDTLKNLPFPLPPLAEQKRIVAKIEQLMALCDKLEAEQNERNQKRLTIHTAAMNSLFSVSDKSTFNTSWEFITNNFGELYSVPQNVKELKKAILQLAMMGKLVPQDPSDQPASELLKEIEAEKKRLIKEGKIKKQVPLPPIKAEEILYEVPKGWKWSLLADICFKITDGFHNTPKKLDTGKKYISATHIREQGIKWNECLYVSEKDHNELLKKAYPRRGEILITNRGAGCGTPAIIDINEEFSFQNAAIIGFNQELIFNKFIFYYLLLNRDHIMRYFVSGGMQPMLSNVTLKTIPFPLPPLAEQKRIVAKIDQLMDLCNILEQQINNSTNKQTAILNTVLAKM